eukprot:PhM_4_TR13836/c0_g1_i1/m.106085
MEANAPNVVINLRPSQNPVWEKHGHTDNTLLLKGTNDLYKVSRVFDGASSAEIFDGAVRSSLAFATSGTNVTCLCLGYTDYVTLTQRIFRGLASAPDASDRLMSVTAFEISALGRTRALFGTPEQLNLEPSVTMWEGDKGLCIGNCGYRNVTCVGDLESFFGTPFSTTEMTVMVAEVFQAMEGNRRMTRSTVMVVHIPEGNEHIEGKFWDTVSREAEAKTAGDVALDTPFKILMHHIVTCGGITTAILPISTDSASLTHSLKSLRKANDLMQLRTFANQQIFVFSAAINDAIETYKNDVADVNLKKQQAIEYGNYVAFNSVLAAHKNFMEPKLAHLCQAAAAAMSSVDHKWHHREEAALQAKRHAYHDKEAAEVELAKGKKVLQEDWTNSAASSNRLKEQIEGRLRTQEDLERERAKYSEVSSEVRSAERELDDYRNEKSEKLRASQAECHKVRAVARQHLADEQDQHSELYEESSRFELTRPADVSDKYKTKLDQKEKYLAMQVELDCEESIIVTDADAESKKRQVIMDLQSQIAHHQREIKTYTNQIQAESEKSPVHDDDDIDVADISLLQDISQLIAQPPTARTRTNKAPARSTSAAKSSAKTSTRGAKKAELPEPSVTSSDSDDDDDDEPKPVEFIPEESPEPARGRGRGGRSKRGSSKTSANAAASKKKKSVEPSDSEVDSEPEPPVAKPARGRGNSKRSSKKTSTKRSVTPSVSSARSESASEPREPSPPKYSPMRLRSHSRASSLEEALHTAAAAPPAPKVAPKRGAKAPAKRSRPASPERDATPAKSRVAPSSRTVTPKKAVGSAPATPVRRGGVRSNPTTPVVASRAASKATVAPSPAASRNVTPSKPPPKSARGRARPAPEPKITTTKPTTPARKAPAKRSRSKVEVQIITPGAQKGHASSEEEEKTPSPVGIFARRQREKEVQRRAAAVAEKLVKKELFPMGSSTPVRRSKKSKTSAR